MSDRRYVRGTKCANALHIDMTYLNVLARIGQKKFVSGSLSYYCLPELACIRYIGSVCG